MFAGNHAAPREHLREKLIERAFNFFTHGWHHGCSGPP